VSTALDKVIELARRIVKDDPDIALSHLGAELCRATCGQGKYAVKYGAPAPSPPAAAAGGKKQGKQKQGRLL
jgi:hypothetical protein